MLKSSKNLLYSPYEQICDIIGADNFFSTADSTRSKKNGGMAIAVGISDNPTGPIKDLGHPLVDEGDWNDIDPTVFIDDDGQAYLYFGNPELRYVLLNEDMISYNKKIGVMKIPMTEKSFAKGSHNTGTTYGEGSWFYKRNGVSAVK